MNSPESGQDKASKGTRWPLLTLYVLSPVIGELLSGSAPPAEFFTPFGLTVLFALYGGGTVIVRDLVRRWRRGWASILLMGAAYGIYEEGIVVRSFFDPAWPDLGLLAEYGRWLGVNWVWAVELTVYHAVISITIPIMLVELLFPTHHDDPWLRTPGWIVVSILFLSVVIVGPLAGMRASVPAILGCLMTIGLLVFLARRWPHRAEPRIKPVPPVRAGWFVGLGFLGMLTLPLVYWALPGGGLPVPLTLLAGVGALIVVTSAAWAMGGRAWTDRQRWAMVAGGLLLWIVFAFLQAADNANRPDDTSGMALVGLTFLVFLIALAVRVWKRTSPVRG